MSTTLVLIRHGQTLSNVTGRYMGWLDEDLSDEGVLQAEKLAARLSRWPIAGVFSSPLKRAMRTAEIVARPHSMVVQKLEDLGEVRIGLWQGLFASEIAARFPDLWKTWRISPGDFRMPEGESLSEVRRRAISALDRILDHGKDRMVVAVTHDVVVRLLVAHCLGVREDIYRRLEVGNASLTVIEWGSERQRLRVLNDTAHLEGSAPEKVS